MRKGQQPWSCQLCHSNRSTNCPCGGRAAVSFVRSSQSAPRPQILPPKTYMPAELLIDTREADAAPAPTQHTHKASLGPVLPVTVWRWLHRPTPQGLPLLTLAELKAARRRGAQEGGPTAPQFSSWQQEHSGEKPGNRPRLVAGQPEQPEWDVSMPHSHQDSGLTMSLSPGMREDSRWLVVDPCPPIFDDSG